MQLLQVARFRPVLGPFGYELEAGFHSTDDPVRRSLKLRDVAKGGEQEGIKIFGVPVETEWEFQAQTFSWNFLNGASQECCCLPGPIMKPRYLQ